MKKFATFLLVLALIMSLAIPALAATNDSITVVNAKAGETYKLYKMFDLKVDNPEDPKAYTYTVNYNWTNFFGESGAGAQLVTINNVGAVTAVSDAAALAKAAATWAAGLAPEASIKAEANQAVVFDNLDDGYWLITSTLGTVAMLETTPDKADVQVNEKNASNTIEKLVKEDSTGIYGESNDAQIGDVIEFKSTVNIVKNTRNVVVHDEMTQGLTYIVGTVKIEDLNQNALTQDVEYTLDECPEDQDTFDISFDQDWIDGLDFGTDGVKSYVITYKATLNGYAITSGENGWELDEQENETVVSFGDYSYSTKDTTHTHTHKFKVFKHATGSTNNLAGAVFQLKKDGDVVELVKLDDNNYRIATAEDTQTVVSFETVAGGDISIWGVDIDPDYTLVETQAPEGYNLLKDPVSIIVDTANGTRVTVENSAGTELPSTGGVGTTLFYVFGGILVLAAVVLLVTKKRMASEKNA